jgi:hypothetical protein
MVALGSIFMKSHVRYAAATSHPRRACGVCECGTSRGCS